MNVKGMIGKLSGASSERSRKVALNIVLSFIAKGISILCSLAIVPLTINYINSTQYGIWLTLSGIIAWIGYFDLGLGNGFRNKFAECRAKGDDITARQYVSTTYFSLAVLMSAILLILLVMNCFIDWTSVLKIDAAYSGELRTVFAILASFFCLSMVCNLFGTLVTADQNPGISSVIYAVGQVLSLGVIFLLTKVSEGSLLNLSVYYAGIPCVVMLLSSVIAYGFSRYRQFAPSARMFRLSQVKDILTLGGQFFLICVAILAIFQVTNIILSRECGPDAVTEYNIAYKYFNVLYSVALLVITPYWSAFTDAYNRKDTKWMSDSVSRLERCCLYALVAGIVMLAVSRPFYRIWIGNDNVTIPPGLSVLMLVYTLASILANVYMYMINGIGTIRIQMVIYLAFAIVAWPVMSVLARNMGVNGVLILPTVVFVVQAVAGKIQLGKLINGTQSGWWAL